MQRLPIIFTKAISALPYLWGAVAVGLTTLVLYSLSTGLNTSVVALLYLLPVVLSAALWGRWVAVTTALCAFFGFNYFFIPPLYTLTVHHPQDFLALIVFLIVAIIISQSISQARSGLAAATAREREATRLYELSTALAGLQDDQAIARTVAEQVLQTFQAERVELGVEGRPGGQAFAPSLAVQGSASARKPELVVPLQTARGLQGEIRLWRSGPPPAPTEERLLRTFASQGALALERARLAQAETRAKVSEESDRLKSALLSSVSHELRSPLATIKASVTGLRSEAVDWDSNARQELLAAVDEETDHLNRLVGNLLDMSRIEAGALKPDRKWNALAEIVGGVAARMRHSPAAQQHRIEIDVSDDLPLAPVDYIQMEQVFTNLISNSLKYAPADTEIRIEAGVADPEWLRVQVSNQGPPVPEEHLERIFDKFYRVTAADRVTGTGLGLSICKGIIAAHGGRIWAENRVGGFAFNFTLPLTLDGLAPPRSPVEPEAA